MPLDSRMLGAVTAAFTHNIDARWIMSYSAGLQDLNPRSMDTSADTVVAHPVFPVCVEWPVILAARSLEGSAAMTPTETARGVHAAHDLHIYRPIRDGDRLTTQVTIIGIKPIKPGAAQMMRLDTVDADGELVCRTYQLNISRGVGISGEPGEIEVPPPLPQAQTHDRSDRYPIEVRAGAAHVYTECARIWNPIHTDRAVALGAGLPDIILHGTATMAYAVSLLAEKFLDGEQTRITRLGGRFTGMVLMPSTLTLQVHAVEPGRIFFSVLTEQGASAFSNGFLCFD